MHIKINNYVNTFSPATLGTITIEEWLENIKSPSQDHLQQITTARQYKSLYVSTGNKVIKDEYDKIKLPLPTVSYNALFTDNRTDKCFLAGTGLLYIDIDPPNFDIESLDKSKIFAYYRSVGGLGYSILVRVTGLTLENFKSTYANIVDSLGITAIYDRDAEKITQQSIISFDPELFINNKSFIFSSINGNNLNEFHFVPKKSHSRKKEEHMRVVGYKTENDLFSVRYTNIKDFTFDSDYLVNWKEGFPFVKCYLPTKKLSDGRKRVLLSYTTNLVYLNPDMDFYHILNIIMNVNERISITPLPEKIIRKILDSILQQKKEGRLLPAINIRRILFNPLSKMEVVDKLDICGKLIKDKYEIEGCIKINEIIEDWNFNILGKISIRSIAANNSINKKTVAKYYSHFQDLIKDLNEQNKGDIKAYNQHKSNIDRDIAGDNIALYMADMTPLNLMEESMVMHDIIYVIDMDEIMEEIFAETT